MMENKRDMKWIMLSVIVILGGAGCIFFAVAFGGCGCTMSCTGADVPMKCHWTMIAVGMTGTLPVICGLLDFVIKDKTGRRAMAILAIAASIILFILPTSRGIGVCAMEGMSCGIMAAGVKIVSCVTAAAGFVQLISPVSKKDMPKRGF